MDLASLVGIIGAFGIILASIFLNGDVSPLIFVNVPSILIVLLGSCMVVLIKFNLNQFIGAFKVASRAFLSKNQAPEKLIEKIVEVAQVAKKDGMLALEEMEFEDEFLQQSVGMLVDGQDPEVIKDVLTKDMKMTVDRHAWGAKIFSALADVSPAMGMIGTLIGLVQMLSNMSDPQSIGPAMAVALLTTLYGAMVANMVAMPIADKLTLRRSEESDLKSICIDGVLAVSAGYNARVVESLLTVYLKPNKRNLESGGEEKAAEAAAT